VAEAWAGSFDALLHRDLAAVNARLAQACRGQHDVRFVPFGSVNPAQPDWQEDLRRCTEEHGMPGIRLHPNYHGYQLDHPAFAEILARAAEQKLVVSLCLAMEDVRMMHPALRVPPVNPAPLAALVAKTPGLRLVLLNSFSVLRDERLRQVVRAGEVAVDISTCEGAGGVAGLLKWLPPERIVFGSYAPFLYFDAATLKLEESALEPDLLAAVQEQNARRLLPESR
jgi:predicted TIM-barrel fold metal-dependent hydrolase